MRAEFQGYEEEAEGHTATWSAREMSDRGEKTEKRCVGSALFIFFQFKQEQELMHAAE